MQNDEFLFVQGNEIVNYKVLELYNYIAETIEP